MPMILVGMVAAPGLLLLLMCGQWLTVGGMSENQIRRCVAGLAALGSLMAVILGWGLLSGGEIRSGVMHWMAVGNYHFELELVVDRVSWPLVTLTNVLVGLVAAFSFRYMHKERGFFRFFVWMTLFWFGALLAFTASSIDLLLGGWELVGVSSVLLIGFFDERLEPVQNANRVFATYRLADLGLLIGIFALHSFVGTGSLDAIGQLSGAGATVVGLLLLTAASGKSAQGPFLGWLPRAMEGPTPSSAIFYGAISVHLGAYLLLRAQPAIEASLAAKVAVISVGLGTALLATLVHRVSADAKSSLAYASMAQIGIIFAEIGLGMPTLALLHMTGHAAMRTLQFLRAPSMLYDHHHLRAAAGGTLTPTGTHYEWLLPPRLRGWLYRVAIERGFYDAVVNRWILHPVLQMARWCEGFEPGNTNRASFEASPKAMEQTRLKEAKG
jgi:NADH-quinone oxidoreductase subunit L